MSTTTVKFKTPTCVLCRQRKLRCDGGNPCGPCSRARTLVVCTYIPKTMGQLRSELPKGGACLSCRQRKRRCDGAFPCITCKSTSRPHECRYQDKPRARKSSSDNQRLRDHRSADGASTTSSRSTDLSRPYTPENPIPLEPHSTSTDNELDVFSLLNFYPELESSGLYPAPTNEHWLSGMESIGGPTLPSLWGFQEYPEASISGPSENKITLPSLPPLDHQIGNSTDFALHPGSALDRTAELFELRNLFLDHSWHYGLNVTEEKRDALSRGDTSGLIVHPVLVNLCELLGYHLADRLQSGTFSSQGQTEGFQAEQAMLIFDVLQRETNVLDPTTLMQVYNLLGVYYAMRWDLPIFTELFNKLATLVARNPTLLGLNDALVVDPTSPVEPSSSCPQGQVQETRSAFSAMIFIELAVSLVAEVPPILDPSALTKFRKLATIHRRDTELNFLRARSALFVYDTHHLVAEWSRLDFGHPSGTLWTKRYWNLIEDIHAHLNVVNTPSIEVSFIHEAQVYTLKTCIIIALAALAQLYSLFAPFQPESERKYKDVIDEIANTMNMFVGKDFQYLDTTLGVCWAVALRPLLGNEVWPKWDNVSAVLPQAESPTSLSIIRQCYQRLRLATHCPRNRGM
ncbi:hypothetical protein B0H13DRAFT_1985385 [Mycena leptocephala]|nr:hypothetical protein B0H13DRAFT_1985385 [Mycena leptocephala]